MMGVSSAETQLGKKDMRERVENLRKTDGGDMDSAMILAKKEDTFRMEHLDQKITRKENGGFTTRAMESFRKVWALLNQKKGTEEREKRNKTADAFSDEVLKTMEAERANGVDALTGLLNRAALDMELPKVFGREIGESEQSGSLLMIDFDHFKEVNDEHGHLAGDDALRQMAKILREAVRPLDRVYRYGGEEFVVYLPKTGVVDAEKAAEHIRKKVEETPIEVTDSNHARQTLHKTVSIGCVGLDTAQVGEAHQALFEKASKKEAEPIPADEVDALIKTLIGYADIAVYAAKIGDITNPDESKRSKHDRNQVVAYRSDLPKRELSNTK